MPDMDADGARRFATAASAHTGRAACTLALLPLEDALALEEQPNLPGTTTQYPNWQLRLPVAAGDIAGLPAAARTSAIMRANDRQKETGP